MFDLKAYQQLNDTNINFIKNILSSTTDEILLNDNQNIWNVFMHLEHILLVEKAVLVGLLKAPTAVAETMELIGNDKLERIIITNRHLKTISPPNFIPKGIYTTKEEAINNIIDLRNKLIGLIGDQTIIPNNRMRQHPFLGDMTMIDWLHFIIHHSHRHYLHIEAQLGSLSAK
jgi:hypothetical protein